MLVRSRAAIAVAMLAAVAAAPVTAAAQSPKPDAPLAYRLAQGAYPWDADNTEAAPKGAQPGKPSAGAQSSPNAPSIEEVAYKGQQIRVRLDAASARLHIELNGKAIGTVNDVGELKKPRVLAGTYQSLVSIWTKNAARDCSSYVLVLLPMTEGAGKPEVRPGFGPCNSASRQLAMKRGSWELWSIIAYRADSSKVSVAVARNERLAVTEHAARPCLFSKEKQEAMRCEDEYLAAGLGFPERGIPSGEERVGGRRLTTFQNRIKNTGSIELEGKTYKTFANVKAFHVEPSVAIDGSALFSVWLHPVDEPCGYRMLLRMAGDGKESEMLDRVGPCRSKAANVVVRRRDDTVSRWTKVMWREGDRQVQVASWNGGDVALRTVEADACILAPTVTSECIDRIAPSGLQSDARSASASQTPYALPQAKSRQGGLLPSTTVQNGFRLLGQNQLDTAIAEFDRALIAEPDDAWAYTGRGYGLALKGKLDNALSDLDRAVQLNPRSAHAFSYRGYVFLLRREPDRAIAQLDQAVLLDPRLAEAYAFRGSAYLAKKDSDRAMTDLDKSIEIRPKNALALGTRGRAYAARNEHRRAIEDLGAAIALAPQSIAYLVDRGRSLEALGRGGDALSDYRAAVALKPGSINDMVTQSLARVRINALEGGGTGAGRGGCTKGQTCL